MPVVPDDAHGTDPRLVLLFAANSVDSFEMLCARFTPRFADSKPDDSLDHVVQRDNELLRQYMARFTKTTLLIPDFHSAVTRHSLLVGLKSSTFLDSLYADPTPNMDSLRARAARYMGIEENANARKQKFQPPIARESPRLQKKVRARKYDRYTPLNTTWETILLEACSLELIRLPHPGRPQPGADPTLRCNYHQSIGHSIEECTKVHDFIEELVQSGALARFVQRSPLRREGPIVFGTRGGREGRYH